MYYIFVCFLLNGEFLALEEFQKGLIPRGLPRFKKIKAIPRGLAPR